MGDTATAVEVLLASVEARRLIREYIQLGADYGFEAYPILTQVLDVLDAPWRGKEAQCQSE